MIGSMLSTTATIKRLSYTSDVGTYSTVSGTTLYGLFLPLDPANQPAEVQMGMQAYKFTTEGSSTVYASDVLTISSTDYQVKGLRRYTVGSLDFLDIILEKAARQ